MRRPTSPLAAGAALVVALFALSSGAHAADLLAGKRLTLKDKANPKQDGVSFTYRKDPGLLALADPTCGSGNDTSIQIVTSNGPSPLVTLPCASWKLSSGGFRYSAKAGGAGGVRSVKLGAGTLSLRAAGPPHTAAGGPVSFVETRFRVGSTLYCGRFAQPPGRFSRNRADLVAVTGPTLPCQLACGDGILDPGEACDDGNVASGDCCSSSCSFESGACNDHDGCTAGDACVNGACVGTTLPPWVNEIDYDDNAAPLNGDRDEFLEIAGPAGTDLGGYQIVSVEGAGPGCLGTGTVNPGFAHFVTTIPNGTVLADDTGTGLGFFVACFSNTSSNVVAQGTCDAILPGPFSDTNLPNGHLTNADLFSCPDGLLVLDADDDFVDALGWEGTVPSVGPYGPFFHVTTPYQIPRDEGWLVRVAIEKTSSTSSRAVAASEWVDPSEAGAPICNGQIGFFCGSNLSTPGAPNPGQTLACGSPCKAFLDPTDDLFR